MAYAALVSLEQTLQNFNHEIFSISDQQQIISLREYVARLQSFLEELSEKGRCLEGQIRDVANEAEDVLECFMMDQSRSSLGLNKSSVLAVVLLLRILNEKIDSKMEEVNIQSNSDVEHLSYFPTSWLLPSHKIITDFTGSVDDLMVMKHFLLSILRTMDDAYDSTKYFSYKGTLFWYSKEHAWSTMGLNKGEHLPRISLMFLSELRKISGKFDSIIEEVMHIQSNSDVEQLGFSPTARLAPNHKINDVVGLDDDLMAIMDRLCADSRKLQVIPIVGMGGIGKTTLARNAYDDTLTREHFVIRAWITVSQDYSRQEILSSLLKCMEISNTDGSKKDDDGEKVYKSLKGRKYLIVMDDMWSTKAWDDVRNLFPDDNNGSRIMLTSRLLDVAVYPDPLSHPHQMHLMKPDLSWDLLRKKVFLDQDCPSELEDIGNKIARNCGGLPLAITVVAGVLSAVTKTLASWREIAENVKSTFGAKEGHLEQILSLSYSHLPHHLRSCFLYMGGFPEDYEIRISKLTKLWIAEGFLKQYPGRSKSLEEEAAKCLEDLIKRNLVLVNNRKSDFNVKICSLHDLVRDMCIRKAQEDKFLQYADQNVVSQGIESQRRISAANFGTYFLEIFGSTVRSLKFFRCANIASETLGECRLLRVLDLICVGFSDHSSVIFSVLFQLIHLRYLALMDYVSIPATISNLQNLQTLIICAWKTTRDYPHDSAAVLPSVIWKMPQLRHLVSFFDPLPDPEDATLSLQNLQTLSQTTNFVCSRRVLGLIPNLQKLGIFYCRGKDDGEYHLENLVHLHQLEKLKIKIYADFAFRQKLNPVFPRTLKKLTLSGYRVPWERITIVGSLPNLEVLKLRDFAYKGSTWETNEGEFSELKYLLIDKSDLQHWITESSHFPRLKSLVLHRCWCLREIPDDIGEIPTLELIEVNGNKSLLESAKRIQDEQQSLGNDSLQVHYLHS